jgi:hypothetical protein
MARLQQEGRRVFSRSTLVVAALSGIIAFAAVAISLPSASRAGTDGSLRFTFKETLASFNVVDSNAHGWTPGDETTFTQTLRDMNGNKVGQVDGDCVITRVAKGHPTAAECGQTFRLGDGWIQADTVDLIKAKSVIPVDGGTRRYQNMTGEIRAGYACGDCVTFVLSR